MKLSISSVNRKEVLQYLNWRGCEIPQEIDQMVDSAMEEMLGSLQIQYIWKEFQIERRNAVSGQMPVPDVPHQSDLKEAPEFSEMSETENCFQGQKGNTGEGNTELYLPEIPLTLPGRTLPLMLADCDRCVLMALTIGAEAVRRIDMAQARDLSRAIVLDACASSAVESACEAAEAEIKKYFGPDLYLTDRFCPGYGDFPLETERELVRILDTPRSIGLTLTDTCILLPRKSVTAIMGLSEREQKKRFRGCAHCNMFERCTYRKGGTWCGREDYQEAVPVERKSKSST